MRENSPREERAGEIAQLSLGWQPPLFLNFKNGLTFFPLTGGCSEGLDAFRVSLKSPRKLGILKYAWVYYFPDVELSTAALG